jgi:hypothetical protein
MIVATVAAGALGLMGGSAALAAGPGSQTGGQGCQVRVVARIQAAEQAGKISQAAGHALIARVEAGHGFCFRHHLRGLLVRETAAFVGETPQQVRGELRAGMSLAQVISAHGKSVSEFEQLVIAQVTQKLSENTRLDASRKQAILAKLPALLDKVLNHVWKAPAKN